MPKIDVFDPPMCCPTGVCGPAVDPALPRFAGDLAWLRQSGVQVARYNLAQEPLAFTTNPVVLGVLKGQGLEGLPVVLVDGALASQGRYPSRDELASWAGLAYRADAASAPLSLPTATRRDPDEGSGCCG